MSTRRRFAMGSLVVLSCWCIGCGASGSRSVVTGKILLDGKPLTGAQVQLLPKSDASRGMHSGTTDDQGLFTITENPGSNNPIVSGTYVVLVSKYAKPEIETEASRANMGGMINIVPEIYLDPSTSPLLIEVKSGDSKVAQLELTTGSTEAAASDGK